MSSDGSEKASVTNLYLNTHLYEPIQVEPNLYGLYEKRILRPEEKLDAYCIDCAKQDTVFTPRKIQENVPPGSNRENFIGIEYTCARNHNHKMYFFFKVVSYQGDGKMETLIKIGQYPSIADLEQSNIKKYRKILGNEKFRELSRAIGLVSHGVGIGSFTYLRRIFEHLVEQAHLSKAKGEPNWDENAYKNAHWDEKIRMVSDLLPSFLINNTYIFSILSKGIHELSENECLEYFDILRYGIEQILDEKLEEQNKQEKQKLVEEELNRLHQKIKSD